MNQILKRTLLPGLVASSIMGVNLGAVRPAAADDGWIRDIGAGAATSVVTGAITGNHRPLRNAAAGAAAGAAVHAVRGNSRHKSNIVRDAAAGAAAGVVTGEITNNHHPLRNAVGGAATGALINIINP